MKAGLETPLLRVSRPVAACSRCRSAKIKCDGKLPVCTACEKTGRENECSSSNDQFARGKERSYVASLESRVDKLEKKLAFARLRKASVAMHEADDVKDDPAERKDSMATIRAAIHGKAARRREATDVNELVSDFGFLSVNATTRDFEQSTTSMTFARLILSSSLNVERPPKTKSDHLPSRPAAMALVQFYLDNVHSLYPAFPETALFTAVDAIYQGGRPVSDFEHWLLYMVLAIGATGQSRSMNDAYYKDGVSWLARALRYSDSVLVPGFVTQMQALVLLVQYSMLDPVHFDSWQLIGFACRALVDLGYHQDPPKESQPDKQALDQRRKLFWCIYALDRSVSMVHARPFSFTDDATSVDLPELPATVPPVGLDSPLPGPHPIHTAYLFFQLRRAQSNWYQELFQSVRVEFPVSSPYLWQICHDMRLWAESFPKTLPAAIKGLFELELLYSYIYCLAPSCRVPAVSELGKNLIYEYSIQYVDKMYPVSKDPINTGFYTYHDALRVFFVGSQLLAVLRTSGDRILASIPPTFINQVQGSPPPPPLQNVSRHDHLERSIKSIEQISEILETYGERWADSKALLENFNFLSKPMLDDLRHRQETRSSRGSLQRTTSDQSSPGSVISSYAAQLAQGQYNPTGDWLSMNQVMNSNVQMSNPQGTHGQMLRPGMMSYGSQGSLGSPDQDGSPQALSGYSQNGSPQATFGHGTSPHYFAQQQEASPQGQQYHQTSPGYLAQNNAHGTQYPGYQQ